MPIATRMIALIPITNLTEAMDAFFGAVLFLGFAAGALLNAAISFLEKEEGDPVRCPGYSFNACRLKLHDCLSALKPSGRRRARPAGMSSSEFFVEAAAAAALLSLYADVFPSGFALEGVFRFALLSFVFLALIAIFVFDFRYSIIPDRAVFPAIGASFLLLASDALRADGMILLIGDRLGAAILAAGFFLFLIWITRGEGMGGGDVKLGFLMGMVLGIGRTFLALFIAFFAGAVIGLALIASRKKNMKSSMPFGPFLILGFLISYFYGNEIIGWYREIFLF